MATRNQDKVLAAFTSRTGEEGPTQFRTKRMIASRAGLSLEVSEATVRQLEAKGLLRHPTTEWMGLARRQGNPRNFWMINGKRGQAAWREAMGI